MADVPIELTEREEAIARRAAELAVKKMQDEFYQEVGRGVVKKGLVILGLLAVGFGVGKGWIPSGWLK